jgi:hypothetical protein
LTPQQIVTLLHLTPDNDESKSLLAGSEFSKYRPRLAGKHGVPASIDDNFCPDCLSAAAICHDNTCNVSVPIGQKLRRVASSQVWHTGFQESFVHGSLDRKWRCCTIVAKDGPTQLGTWLFLWLKPQTLVGTHIYAHIRSVGDEKDAGAFSSCLASRGNTSAGPTNDNNINIIGYRYLFTPLSDTSY